jgi:Heterokaryon incompatibility protein (HET)
MQLVTKITQASGATQPKNNAVRYCYCQLDRIYREIRLLRILQGHSSEISCELHTFPLNACPNYEAVSHYWGPIIQERYVLLEGRTLQIRDHLFEFLRVLHSRKRDGYFWIDAICIDQESNSEKIWQIPMMSRIYRRETRVIIWLGLQGVNSIVADLLKTLCESPSNKLAAPTMLHEQTDLSVAINRFFSLEYWSRVWVVSEIMLARSLCVFFGFAEIPWEALVNTVAWLSKQPSTSHFNSFEFLETAGAIMIKARQALVSGQARNNRRMPLKDLIQIYGHMNATITADKIYSLLSLSESHIPNQKLRPVYKVRKLISFDVNYQRTNLQLCHVVWDSIIASHGQIMSCLDREEVMISISQCLQTNFAPKIELLNQRGITDSMPQYHQQ